MKDESSCCPPSIATVLADQPFAGGHTALPVIAEHAQVADGASNLVAQIFRSEFGHVRLVYGVQSLPTSAPVMVDTIFEMR